MKLIPIILIATLIFPPCLFANPPDENAELAPKPKVTGIAKGEKAPYAGVLLNSSAAAKIFSERSYSVVECQLKIDYMLQKEIAKHQLFLKSMEASLEATNKKYNAVIQIKDKEIEKLTDIALKKKDYSTLWATAGFLVGVTLTIGMFFVVSKVAD